MKTTSQKGMLWVLATLTIAVMPQLLSMPLQLAVLVVLPIGWRLLAELQRWKPPRAWVRVGLTLLSVWVVVVNYGGLFGRRAAVSLLALMLAMKLLETFRVRDARIVASLCLFLCATQFLFSQGIPMLLYSGATLACGLISLALLHRREAFLPIGEAPATSHSMFADFGFVLKLLVLAIPAALSVFLLFPRWSSPMWGVPEAALDARSGLSGSMSPGSIQGLFMDDSPAFRAEFEDRLPPSQALYWRGPVLWDFDGREWSGLFYSRGLRAETQPEEATAPWRYRVQLEPHEQRWVFALDYPATIPRGTRLTVDYQLYSWRPITNLVSYEVASDPDFVDSPQLRPALLRAALELPEGFNPQTRALVQSWAQESASPRQIIDRTLSYFNREEFRYTLNPPLLTRHTVDEFLFETRAGFCEHYASAFTVMMRMAGIPARVVTGYQGGWYNEAGRYVLVRQSDAHAWSEVWLPEVGWTRVDPTAAVSPERIEGGALDALSGRRHALDFAWVRHARNSFDLLQRRWNDWVIAFNADRQSRLFMPFGLGQLDTTQLVVLMLAAAVLASALTLPLVLRLRVSREQDPAIRAWRRFRSRLARAGVETHAGQTPMELSASAGSQMQQAADEINRIAVLYSRVRYAAGTPPTDELIRAVRAFRPARQPH